MHASDAYAGSRNGRFLTEEHIQNIVSVVEAWADKERFSRVVKLQDIQAKDFNLQVTRYVDTYEHVWTSTLKDVQQRLQDAEARRSQLAEQMDTLLAKVRT